MKIPISTIREIISNQHKMLRNCLEEDVCLYRPNAWLEGEFEWLKTLLGPQLENCRKLLSLGVRKPLKKKFKQPLHHHMLFGRVSRKIILAHPKTNSSIFSYQTRLEIQMGLASTVKLNKKNTQDGFGEHRDKKYPMCILKYTAVLFMLWAYISAGGPGHLV